MGGITHCAGRPDQPPVKDPAMVLKEFLPLELVFMPAWWHKHYGIKFDQSFYLDKETRIRNEQAMNQALYERYGEMRLGQADYERRPILGSKHVAGGFVVPALMGCQIDFVEDRNLYTMGVSLTDEQAMQLEVPDPRTTWPMNQLLADMDELEAEFGYVEGDFDLDGAFNLAISLRGQHLFLDFRKAPAIARRLLDVCARALVAVAECVKSRTGTLSIATNRMITHVDKSLFLHSNCSVQMVSPATYTEFLLEPELYLAARLQPYGIYYCGSNMHRYTATYARVPAAFFDVGWGIGRGRLPQSFARAFLQPPAQPGADEQRLTRRDRRWRRAPAHQLPALGAGRGMLHQHGPQHAGRKLVGDVRNRAALSPVRRVKWF